jgi:hypothetical protein
VGGAVEDAVGFEIPGEDEEKEHDAGRPVEELQREGGGEGRVRPGRCLAKEQGADKADSGGESEQEERVEDSVLEGRVGEHEFAAANGKECGVEQGAERQQAEQEGDGLGEFEQHAPALSEIAGRLEVHRCAGIGCIVSLPGSSAHSSASRKQ